MAVCRRQMAGSRVAAPAVGRAGNDRPALGRRRGLPCRQRFHHAADAVCAGFERDGTDRHAPPAAAVCFRRHRSAAVLGGFVRRRAHPLFSCRQKRRARHADAGLCLRRFRRARAAALSGQHRQILAGRGQRLRVGEHTRRRRVRPALASGGAGNQQTQERR